MAPEMMSGSLLAIDAISWALTRAVMLRKMLINMIIGLFMFIIRVVGGNQAVLEKSRTPLFIHRPYTYIYVAAKLPFLVIFS